MKTPTAHEKYAAIARAKGQTCTPYRLGIAVGEAGDNLPSPYVPGTRGDSGYLAGVEHGQAGRRIDAKARQLYTASTANDPIIHCNRFPAWSELTGPQRWPWREKAIAALAAGVQEDPRG